MELSMFFNLGLDKEDTFFRIQTETQPTQSILMGVCFDGFRILVFRAQSMPGDDRVKTLILVLQLEPIPQGSSQVAKMQRPGGSHSAENSLFLFFAHST